MPFLFGTKQKKTKKMAVIVLGAYVMYYVTEYHPTQTENKQQNK